MNIHVDHSALRFFQRYGGTITQKTLFFYHPPFEKLTSTPRACICVHRPAPAPAPATAAADADWAANTSAERGAICATGFSSYTFRFFKNGEKREGNQDKVLVFRIEERREGKEGHVTDIGFPFSLNNDCTRWVMYAVS